MKSKAMSLASVIITLLLIGCGQGKRTSSIVPSGERTTNASTEPLTAESETSPDSVPIGAISFQGATMVQVLAIYGKLSGAELDVEQRVRSLPTPIFIEGGPGLKQSEALRLLEQALLEQAAVVMTHVD